jgi:hypothetical protein
VATAKQTIPGNFGIAKLRWQCNGIPEEVISTLGVGLGVVPEVDEPGAHTSFAQQIADAWQGNWPAASLNNQWRFVGVDMQLYLTGQIAGGAASVPEVESYISLTGQGGGTFNCVPAQVCLLVEKNTATGGKPGKGRMFLPAGYVSSGEVSPSGQISTAALNAAKSNMDAFLASVKTGPYGAAPHLFHGQRESDGVVVGPAGAPSEITSFSIDPRVATQKGRMHR